MDHDRHDPATHTIHLVDGEAWNYDSPLESEFTIHSIGHALARENRYAGHFVGPQYSVAEHAILVAMIVRQHFGATDRDARRYALAALHHDDSEFVLKDLPTPLKNFVTSKGLDWHDLEHDVLLAVSNKFNIPMDDFSAGIIKDADDLAYAAEVVKMKRPGHGPIPFVEPEVLVKLSEWIHNFDSHTAEALFIQLHQSFTEEREEGYPDIPGMDVEPPENQGGNTNPSPFPADMPDDPFLES